MGECILWTVESIRLGIPASMGCHMVEVNAENYEAIYFLSDEEILDDTAARYRRWWETRSIPGRLGRLIPVMMNRFEEMWLSLVVV